MVLFLFKSAIWLRSLQAITRQGKKEFVAVFQIIDNDIVLLARVSLIYMIGYNMANFYVQTIENMTIFLLILLINTFDVISHRCFVDLN